MTRIVRKVKSKPKTIIVGVDPSLVGTALAVTDYDNGLGYVKGWCDQKSAQKKNKEYLNFYKVKDQSDSSKMDRLDIISNWVVQIIIAEASEAEEVYVALEGYAMASRSRGIIEIHELIGVIKHRLWKFKIPIRIYPPTVLKKAWTGSGHADKSAMLMACYKEFGVDFTGINKFGDNLADAVLLSQLLTTELKVRRGDLELKELNPNLRGAMLNVSKHEPDPIVSRPFMLDDASYCEPICNNNDLIGRIAEPIK